MLRPIIAIDATLTRRLNRAGQLAPAFWQFLAQKGIGGFSLVTAGVLLTHPVNLVDFFLPLFAVYLAVSLAQLLIKRPRPDSQKSATNRYKMWWRTYSFPSGHATAAACLTTLLVMVPVYGALDVQIFIGVSMGTLTLLIALSRVMVGVHYVSDILAGLCIGVLAGLGFNL
jgi:membrane-associated phospholipid phosphatase